MNGLSINTGLTAPDATPDGRPQSSSSSATPNTPGTFLGQSTPATPGHPPSSARKRTAEYAFGGSLPQGPRSSGGRGGAGAVKSGPNAPSHGPGYPNGQGNGQSHGAAQSPESNEGWEDGDQSRIGVKRACNECRQQKVCSIFRSYLFFHLFIIVLYPRGAEGASTLRLPWLVPQKASTLLL